MKETTLGGILQIYNLSKSHLTKIKIVMQEKLFIDEETFILLCHYATTLDAICLLVEDHVDRVEHEGEDDFDYEFFLRLIRTAADVEGSIAEISPVLSVH